MHFAANQL